MATYRIGAGVFCVQSVGEFSGIDTLEDAANANHGTTFGAELTRKVRKRRGSRQNAKTGQHDTSVIIPAFPLTTGAFLGPSSLVASSTVTLTIDTSDTLILRVYGEF